MEHAGRQCGVDIGLAEHLCKMPVSPAPPDATSGTRQRSRTARKLVDVVAAHAIAAHAVEHDLARPALLRFVDPVQRARASARVRDGSPVYWRTRHSPSSSRRLSMPTTTHCTPKASASSSINRGRPSAGELIDTLSAPACRTPRRRRRTGCRLRRRTECRSPRHALDPSAVDAAAFRAGRDVVEHEFVGAFVAIAQRESTMSPMST
jgi:hypothetical protein